MNSEKHYSPITSITSSLTRNTIPTLFICNFTITIPFHPMLFSIGLLLVGDSRKGPLNNQGKPA
jgi:hypothetical protein